MDLRKHSQSHSFSSVQSLGHVRLFATPWTAARQASCPSSTHRVYSNSSPLSQWCHPTILPSVVPFSPCPQSFPASGSFQMSELFASGGQSIGVSASVSVLPKNIQDWSPLGWTGWISLQSKGLSRVFSNTTVQSINSSALSFLYSHSYLSQKYSLLCILAFYYFNVIIWVSSFVLFLTRLKVSASLLSFYFPYIFKY